MIEVLEDSMDDFSETRMQSLKLSVTIEEADRIDKYLAEALPEYSRSYLKSLIDEDLVSVKGKPVKGSFKVLNGMEVEIHIPPLKEVRIIPEDIPLSILYEDEDLLFLDKPKDMVVHPAPGHYQGTLVNGLMFYLKGELSGINGELRPGIVHRIDKDTTGVIVVCKNDTAHRAIAEQLKEHSITRRYIALVHGIFKESEGTVDAPIGRHPTDRKKMSIHTKSGKRAVTHYRVLKEYRLKNGVRYSLVECRLETGRTHQIRVHLTSLHHPIVGDEVYGSEKKPPFHLNGQTLHAAVLGLIHPRTGEYLEVEAPLPLYYKELLKKLDTMCE